MSDDKSIVIHGNRYRMVVEPRPEWGEVSLQFHVDPGEYSGGVVLSDSDAFTLGSALLASANIRVADW